MSSINWAPFIEASLVLLLGILGSLAMLVRRWVDSKIKNDSARAIFDRAADFVGTEVHAIEQAVLPEIKAAMADGKVTPEEAKRIRNMAIDRVKENLGEEGRKQLTAALGERPVQDYLVSLLEANIAKSKAPAP